MLKPADVQVSCAYCKQITSQPMLQLVTTNEEYVLNGIVICPKCAEKLRSELFPDPWTERKDELPMRTTRCRGCGAEIGFIKTVAGKTMPVDVNSVRFALGGTEVFVLPDGQVVHGTRLKEGEADPTESIGYISHFATCTTPDAFRKSRKSDRKKG